MSSQQNPPQQNPPQQNPPQQCSPQSCQIQMYPVQSCPTGAVIVQPVSQLKDAPTLIQCPYCTAQIVTGTVYRAGLLTYLLSFVVCIIGCPCFCCFIPFCIDATKDVSHMCPNCGVEIYQYHRL